MSANFDEYLVLLPTSHDGIDFGDLQPLRILALDERDAINKAVEMWWSGSLLHGDGGVAVVVRAECATAYVLGEIKGVEIVAQTNLPDKATA